MVECPGRRRHVEAMRTLEQLHFSNSYAGLPDTFHTRLRPTPLEGSRLLSFNPAAAALLDLDPAEAQRPEFTRYLSGAAPLPGSEPLAALYAGHQFGHYVPQLGDGRAVLRSSIREYLAGEAMHGLGIPTTRALCLFGSDEEVWRETLEKGALLVRLAPSHVRFGSFEVFYYRRQFEPLRRLADYVIEHHYPQLGDEDDRYLALFREVTARTARLIALWQAVGFAHGVMNTDNMSILGLTLDYGPYAFLDDYDPGLICNHSDYEGRYAFDRQPAVAHWNLSRLGQALLPLLDGTPQAAAERANAVLGEYQEIYARHYHAAMAEKLGLRDMQPGDAALMGELLGLLAADHVDYTGFFRALGRCDSAAEAINVPLRDLFLQRDAYDRWAAAYTARLRAEQSDDAARQVAMDRINPRYILRNYLAQQAISRAEQGDYDEIGRLLRLLQAPFDEHPDLATYAAPPPDWGRRLTISCSS
jgi:uncharacterized protein YdiU (UPF0061 family)